MKKLLCLVAAVLIIASNCVLAEDTQKQSVQMLPVFSEKSENPNTLWVGTFQLVWNDFSNKILKGPVVFKDGESLLAQELNKQEFNKTMLSEDSYYTAYGKTSLSLKRKIEKAIMKKFNEKSDLLDKIDWKNHNNAYLLYAMLKKDFQFTQKFDVLESLSFNNSSEKFKFFGIDEKSRSNIKEGVDVLFYNSPSDYAVALKSNKDEVILYRTDAKESFSNIYSLINKESKEYKGKKRLSNKDELKVPFMSFKGETNYDELCNKEIVSKKSSERLYIAQALQTADFNLDNTGVKLKSEAVLNIMTMSLVPEKQNKGRNFYFDKTFYLFMKETKKAMPYFAVRVDDMNLYKYTGEIK